MGASYQFQGIRLKLPRSLENPPLLFYPQNSSATFSTFLEVYIWAEKYRKFRIFLLSQRSPEKKLEGLIYGRYLSISRNKAGTAQKPRKSIFIIWPAKRSKKLSLSPKSWVFDLWVKLINLICNLNFFSLCHPKVGFWTFGSN